MRTTTVLILLFSVLFLPFWLSALIAFLGILYFHIFLEAVVLFFLSDLLYGVGEPKLFGIYIASTLTSLLILAIIEILKRRLKFYPE
ncbi:MAG: hypothetical protein WD991_00595 [Candidatus Paceibacterota bacterium]